MLNPPSKILIFFHPRNIETLRLCALAIVVALLLLLFFLRKKRKWINVLFINLSLILFFVLTYYFIFSKTVSESYPWKGPGPFKVRRFIGNSVNVFKSSGVTEHILKINGKLEYKVDYLIGLDGFRVTPNPPPSPQNSFIFLGCSQTFGQGVKDDETFPALIQKKYPQSLIKNFGIPGGTTNHALQILEMNLEKDVTDKAPPKKFIYSLISEHLKRNTLKPFWLQKTPLYVLDKNNEIINQGFFSLERNLDAHLWKINWENYLHVGPSLYDENDLQFFFKLILKIQKIIKYRYPEAQFTVVFLDLWLYDLPPEFILPIYNFFKENNIEMISLMHELPECFPPLRKCEYRDGHFTAYGHKLIAELLERKWGHNDANK